MSQAAGLHWTHIGSYNTAIFLPCSHWNPHFQIRKQSPEKINSLPILLGRGRAQFRTAANLERPGQTPPSTRGPSVSRGPSHPALASDVYNSTLRGFETTPTHGPALPGLSLPSLSLQWLLLIFWLGACQEHTLFNGALIAREERGSRSSAARLNGD